MKNPPVTTTTTHPSSPLPPCIPKGIAHPSPSILGWFTARNCNLHPGFHTSLAIDPTARRESPIAPPGFARQMRALHEHRTQPIGEIDRLAQSAADWGGAMVVGGGYQYRMTARIEIANKKKVLVKQLRRWLKSRTGRLTDLLLLEGRLTMIPNT